MKFPVRLIIAAIGVLVSVSSFAQKNNEFAIYAITDHYNKDSKDFIKSHEIFRDIKLLGGYMIDPKRRDLIDSNSVEKYINILYPSSTAEGTICIDLENSIYKNLERMEPDDPRFLKSINSFSNLILFIKKMRPGLKVGIYGIPFRVYYQTLNNVNLDNRFDELLKLCDYIAPSLYIMYLDKEKGKDANLNYLQKNLTSALKYGKRLNKPVLPFVWYAVHPGNRTYGRNLISKSDVLGYLDYMRNFQMDNTKINGIIWYDGQTFGNANKNKVLDKNTLLRDYLTPIVK